MVGSRESADPLNIVESLFGNDNDPTNNLGVTKNTTADKEGECKPKKNKEIIENFNKTLLILIQWKDF